MPLIKSGKQAIADAMNAKANIGVLPKQLIFGIPQPLDNPDPSGPNTSVKVTATQDAPARGATIVQYTRQDFSKFFTEPDGANALIVRAPFTTNFAHDLFPNFLQFAGLALDASDIEDTTIDRNAMTVELIAKPESLGWLGQVKAKLIDGDAIISDTFPQTALTGFHAYPNFNTLLGQAAIYSYRYDFSDYTSLLSGITAGNLPLQSLAQMLKTVTGNDWAVSRSPSDYNLSAAEFRYNGLNNNPQYSGNRNYSRVLVIELAFYSLKLGGLLYIHYNA